MVRLTSSLASCFAFMLLATHASRLSDDNPTQMSISLDARGSDDNPTQMSMSLDARGEMSPKMSSRIVVAPVSDGPENSNRTRPPMMVASPEPSLELLESLEGKIYTVEGHGEPGPKSQVMIERDERYGWGIRWNFQDPTYGRHASTFSANFLPEYSDGELLCFATLYPNLQPNPSFPVSTIIVKIKDGSEFYFRKVPMAPAQVFESSLGEPGIMKLAPSAVEFFGFDAY